MKDCEPALWELLDPLCSGNVYFLQAPQGATGPFIIIQRTDSTRWRSINGPSGMAQAYIQIDCYASTIRAARTLGMAVESALDGYANTVYYGSNSPQDYVKIGGISLQNDSDTLDQTDDPLLYRNLATYLVTYNQKD